MKVAVVYESLYGHTHEVAEAVAAGVRDASPDAEVELVRVGEADPRSAADADLLVVGGPTHMRGMTTGLSRKLGVSAEAKKDPADRHELEPDAEGPGIRDWFHGLPNATGARRAAAFDTRIEGRLAGGAAVAIARRMRHHGYEVVADPEGFLVADGGDGPLVAGEANRARAWGAVLAREAALTGPVA